MNHRVSRLAASLALAGSLWIAAPAEAGPPLICFPYEIGEAKSLPWGKGKFDADKRYDRDRVVADTLAILKTADSTLVRMETLRRATLYVKKDRDAATELLAKLSWMALDAEAAENTAWAKNAWFDAGFLAACYHQAGVDVGWKPGVENGLQGWAWVKKSLDLGADDPDRQFAAALILQEKNDGSFRPYLVRAVSAAEPGSDLARTIESNPAFGDRKFEDLRASLGAGDARTRDTGR